MIGFRDEQRFIVVGATGGIGEATALLLNKLGASVVAIGRNAEKLKEIKAKAVYAERMFLEQKDLIEDIAGLPTYVKSLKEKYGRFHGLAYCAGVTSIKPLRAVDYEEMQKIFAVNYFAPVFLAKGFADKRNNNGWGSAMVFIASRGGVIADPGMTSYAGSKGALIVTMQAIAKEVASSGVRINCVSPALIETNMADDVARQYAEGKYPMGLGQVEDPAHMIAFLLSDQARWISAQNYVMDCGLC